MNGDKYIGLDVHQATISVAVLDSAGKLLMESVASPITRRLRRVPSTSASSRTAGHPR